jgi:kynurenine formamidase
MSAIIDLTYPFDDQTIYWPTDQPFHWEKETWGMSPEGYWYAAGKYAASEHGGTHLDAPLHFGQGQWAVDQIPLERLTAPALVVDIARACSSDRDYGLTVHDVASWEETHGGIPDGVILLVRTGWGKYWPDKKQYLGTDAPGDTAHLHFPGISPSAAEFLSRERKIYGVGIDTLSIDPGPSTDFMTHRVLNGAGIYALENLANLEKVPETGATLIALPMKITGASGAPVRIIALVD